MINAKIALKYSIVLTSLLLLIGSLGYSIADGEEEVIIPKNEIYGAYKNHQGYFGFFNYYGSMIKSPVFDLLWKWDDEVIILRRDGKFGAIDYEGYPAVSFEYEFLDEPSNGTIIFGKDITYQGPTTYGLIDTKGHQIADAQYHSAEKLPNGGIITSLKTQKISKYGVVFSKNVIIPPSYDEIVAYNAQFVVVKNIVNDVSLYGVLSQNGRKTDIEYSNIQLAKDGQYAIAESIVNGVKHYEILDKYCHIVNDRPYGYISPKGFTDNEGEIKKFVAVRPLVNGHLSKTFDLLLTSGDVKSYDLIKVDYTPIGSSYYKVIDTAGRIGLVDKDGLMTVRPSYTGIEAANDDYFVGVKKDQRGIFDYLGNPVMGLLNYDSIQLTEDGGFIVQIGHTCNVLDENQELLLQLECEGLRAISKDRYIVKKDSHAGYIDGGIKYYYSLIDITGKELIESKRYVYMESLQDGFIAVGRDIDGKAATPSGFNFLRAPFADLYGLYDINEQEILPSKYRNLTRLKRGLVIGQETKESTYEAFDVTGKKINNEIIWSVDPFNSNVVSMGSHETIQKGGYLLSSGKFVPLVYELDVDDAIVTQTLKTDGSLLHIIESKTTIYENQVIDNLVNEEIIKRYYEIKKRFKGDIYILKDEKWYLDNFYQEGR